MADINEALLNDQHRLHLLEELGSAEAVSKAITYGARSVTSEEVKRLGYGIRGTDGEVHHLEGLLLPFGGNFGQLRPDNPIVPFEGKKPAKYISKAGANQTIATFGDGDPEIATEGWKDALALHLATGKSACAIAGVSAWKLLPPSVKLLIYDADAACKPGVWGALASAGLVRRNLKLAFFPVVKGDSSAGACEFFRHHDDEAFKAIPRFTARDLIHSICNSWSRDIRADLQTSNLRTLATIALRAGFDESTVTLLVEGAAKQNLRMRVDLARDILGKVLHYNRRQGVRKRKQERLEKLRGLAAETDPAPAPVEGDDLGDLATTFGHIVLTELFGGGKEYASIGGALYKYAGDHYALMDRPRLRRKIASFATKYIVENRAGEPTVPYATTNHIDEALEFLLCATGKSAEDFNPGGYVNCTNGVLKLSWGGPGGRTLQWELIKHTIDLIFTSPPGCAFEPGADPSEFERMMKCLTPAEGDMLMERMGASLDVPTVRRFRDRIPASFCIGDGSNGKDTTEICFSRIIGAGAVSGCRISDFKNYDTGSGAGRFNIADLSTSRANISSENSAGVKIEHCESLKAAISGERLVVEKKSVQSWAIWPQSVMFFNFNKPPIIDGVTAAIGSRVDIFSFDQTYSSEPVLKPGELPADPRFKNDAEWVGSNVLPAMLNAMLAGLQSVISNGFSREAGRAAMRSIQKESTHLVQLLEDLGLEPGTRHDRIGRRLGPKELWPFIQDWYVKEGRAKRGYDGELLWPPADPNDRDHPIRGSHRIVPMLRRVAPSIGTTGVGQGKKALVGLKVVPGGPLAHLDLAAAAQGDDSDSGTDSPGDPEGGPAGQNQVTADPLPQNQGDPSDPINLLRGNEEGGIGMGREGVSPCSPIGRDGGEKQGHQPHLPCAATDLPSPAGPPPGSPRATTGEGGASPPPTLTLTTTGRAIPAPGDQIEIPSASMRGTWATATVKRVKPDADSIEVITHSNRSLSVSLNRARSWRWPGGADAA